MNYMGLTTCGVDTKDVRYRILLPSVTLIRIVKRLCDVNSVDFEGIHLPISLP